MKTILYIYVISTIVAVSGLVIDLYGNWKRFGYVVTSDLIQGLLIAMCPIFNWVLIYFAFESYWKKFAHKKLFVRKVK